MREGEGGTQGVKGERETQKWKGEGGAHDVGRSEREWRKAPSVPSRVSSFHPSRRFTCLGVYLDSADDGQRSTAGVVLTCIPTNFHSSSWAWSVPLHRLSKAYSRSSVVSTHDMKTSSENHA